MKIKNIVQVITLTGLLVSGSAHCMLINGLKRSIACAGNALLYGPAVLFNGIGLAKLHSYMVLIKDPVAHFEKDNSAKVRDPNAQELALFQQYIPENMKLKIEPNGTGAHSGGDLIVLGDSLCSTQKLHTAIEKNDLESQKFYIAALEHEREHNKKNHHLKEIAHSIGVPLITTYLTAKTFKKFAPFSVKNSLLKQFGIFSLKSISGAALLAGNGIAHLCYRQHQEFEADQGISPQHKEAMIKEFNNDLLKETLNLITMTEQQRAFYLTARKWKIHPPFEERIKRLQQSSTKTA